jgi:O-antigen ligase
MSLTGQQAPPASLAGGGFPGEPALLRDTHTVPLLTSYLVLLMFIPSALVLSPLGGAGGPATLFAVVLIGWYAVMWLHPRFALDHGHQPVRFAALVFVCVTLASYISANRHGLTTLEKNGADRGLILLAGWLGVLLLAADGIATWDRLVTLLRRVVAAGSLLACLGLTQFATGLNLATYITIPGFITKIPFSDLLTRGGFNRPSATTAQPLEFAAVLAVCLPLALHQARYAPPGTRARRWFQVAVIAGALPLTVSRSAALGIAVVALMLLPTWPARQRRAAYGFFAGAVAVMWVALPSLLSLFGQLFTQIGSESSSTSRIQAYSAITPFVTGHPWLGQGYGTFLPQTYFFIDNQYLTTLVETGFVGLVALVGLMVTGVVVARKARRLLRDEQSRDLLQCLAASVAAAAVSFATFDGLSFPIATGLTFLTLGCVGAAFRLAQLSS